MEASHREGVTADAIHAPPPSADLVGGHVTPVAVEGSTMPSHKRESSVIVQGDTPAAAAMKVCPPARPAVSDANLVRQPPAKKGKFSNVKGKNLTRKVSPPTPPPIASTRASMSTPGDGDAAAPEVFDGMGARYKDMEVSCKKAFQLEHCWKLLKDSEKWKVIEKESQPKRGALTKMDDDDDDEEDDIPRNKNKPDGNKKANDKIKKKAEALSLRDKLDHMVKSNEILMIKTLEAKKELAKKKGQEKQEKWKLLKEETDRKAAIERRAKAEEDKAMDKLLQEENKIMMMNWNEMDEVTKEWHVMARLEILERRR
ncbi:Lactation elevated protein 1 [Hordeum vulgare]|nr:Lactation elevated protein 1 [Hordeum vulgare]